MGRQATIAQRGSNLQLQVGVEFDTERSKTMRSPDAIGAVKAAAHATKPFIDFLLG